ncbi:hypothetical protein GO755_07745 [Spirosoma sp. HMF4905]|uniref:Uncharacterized protein n=1 Tax=Spirosoma arboris TaxID=2682092 RepID=A0A7K1S847_9BACT|nr:hypothetical protein [Spirosoma arboris]MVM29920.1 hypothetical protein [Spirosoma arboris]
MAFVIDKTAELIFLQKALSFIKFQSEDYEAHYLAVSPYSGDLLRRVHDELSDYYKSSRADHQTQFGRIEAVPHYLAGLRTHLSHIDNWSTLTKEVQMSAILDLAAPFTIDQQTLDQLIASV